MLKVQLLKRKHTLKKELRPPAFPVQKEHQLKPTKIKGVEKLSLDQNRPYYNPKASYRYAIS
jgi:hypothetical protein